MAVVKSLKNNKHKKLWVKKHTKFYTNQSSLHNARLNFRKSPKKPMTWLKTKLLKTKLRGYSSIYGLNNPVIRVINIFYYK